LRDFSENMKKPQENIEEIINKLELFNPINGRISEINDQNENFYENVSEMIDAANSLQDQFQIAQDLYVQHNDFISQAYQPIREINNREVSSPELETAKE